MPGGGVQPIRVNLNRALRQYDERILVQAGDVLILQETPCEALARYFTDVFAFRFLWRAIDRPRTTGAVDLVVP
jgi:hypothetical protein